MFLASGNAVAASLQNASDPVSIDAESYTNKTSRSLLIQDFSRVIDELCAIPANNISISAPDFYEYFRSTYAAEHADNVHPNGEGCQAMANIWLQAITGF